MNSLTLEQRRRLRWLLVGGAGSALFIGVMFLVGSIASRKAREANAVKLNAPIVLHGPHVSMRPTVGPPPVIAHPVIAPETPQDAQLLRVAEQRAAQWLSTSPSKGQPLVSGPGIVVGEPVSAAVQSDFAAFGAGCGRWLHLAVGGWGALGKTPPWGLIDDQRRTLHKPDFRLKPTDVTSFAAGLGVTHLALGTLSGTPAQATLSYQVWTVSPPQPLGAPLTVSGTRDQIVAQLPVLARRIGTTLGAGAMPPVHLPSGTAAELAQMGAVPFKVPSYVPDERTWQQREAQRKMLTALAPRLPLAGVLVMRSGTLNEHDSLWKTLSVRLPQIAPGNVLVLSDLVHHHAHFAAASSTFKTQWHQAIKQFPDNFALAVAWLNFSRAHLAKTPQHNAAYHEVLCSPQSAFGWYELSEAYDHEADIIRQGRFITEMSRSELAAVERLYSYVLVSALNAARLEPQASENWLQVATSACFDSHQTLADAAYWRAWRLSPRNIETLGWGLEMFQPKWHNEPDNLRKVATEIEADRPILGGLGQDAMDALAVAGLTAEANSMLNRTIALYVFRAKRTPKDADAHYRLARLYTKNGSLGGGDLKNDAINEYKAYLALRPQDAQSQYELASLLYDKKLNADAEAHYHQALALDPTMTDALSELGDLVYEMHHDAKMAERLYRKAITLKMDTPAHIGLATLLLDAGKKAEALAQARRAIALGYTNQEDVYTRLGLKPDVQSTATPSPFHA